MLLFVWFIKSGGAWLVPWISQPLGVCEVLYLTGDFLVGPIPWLFLQYMLL